MRALAHVVPVCVCTRTHTQCAEIGILLAVPICVAVCVCVFDQSSKLNHHHHHHLNSYLSLFSSLTRFVVVADGQLAGVQQRNSKQLFCQRGFRGRPRKYNSARSDWGAPGKHTHTHTHTQSSRDDKCCCSGFEFVVLICLTLCCLLALRLLALIAISSADQSRVQRDNGIPRAPSDTAGLPWLWDS